MSFNLSLENFQSFKEASLTVKGLTVLKGESHLGKTAVRRAFETVVFAKYKPSYIRVGAKSLKVSFDYKDLSATVERSKTKNIYTINGKVLQKAGKGQIEEIASKGLDDYELTVSTQYEPLFMLGDSMSKTTQRVNKVLGVSLYEKVAIEAKKRKLETSNIVKYLQEEIKCDLDNLRNLKELRGHVYSYEQDRDLAKYLDEYILYLEKFNSLKDLREKLTEFLSGCEITHSISEYIGLLDRHREAVKLRDSLRDVLSVTDTVTNLDDVIYARTLREHYDNMSKKVSSEIVDLVERFSDLNEYIELLRSKKRLITKRDDANSKMIKLDKELKKYVCKCCNQVILSKGSKSHDS